MIDGLFIAVTIGNILSLIIFTIVYREIHNVLDSQIYAVGWENKDLVVQFSTKLLIVLYSITTMGLSVLSYFLLLT